MAGDLAYSSGGAPQGDDDRRRDAFARLFAQHDRWLFAYLVSLLGSSAAAEEVLPIYKLHIDALRPRFRVFRDKTASGVPVGMLYDDIYHTVVVAPATSNTVAKCAFGISDTLPTNMFAQAGKLGIPGIVFACDTEPVVVTKSPHDWVTLRPRRIELDNVERLRGIDFCHVVASPAELEAVLDARMKELSLAWNTSSS